MESFTFLRRPYLPYNAMATLATKLKIRIPLKDQDQQDYGTPESATQSLIFEKVLKV